jgi:flagellar biosynthesis protein FlhA
LATLAENIERYIPGKASSIFMPLVFVGVLAVMIVPLPPFLLDFLLSLNITLAVVILLVVLYVVKPLNFSIFPTVLLLTTLYRLSLNVGSTRLILLHGNEGQDAAGQVIKAFGNFVVGGNFAVGMVIFLILVVINFAVITKGAGRIAEVSARFTLDAMPGKQMSIDADLNAGLITDDEARDRREEINREANFYGAMDGASKFVRGDAIAGIIITFINLIGGLIIGVVQNNMSFPEAFAVYSVLTIGDGLVAQIPAIVISTAAGVIVTRSATKNTLTKDIVEQIFSQPMAIASASGVLFILGLIPGLPHVAFLSLSVITGAVAYNIIRKSKLKAVEEERAVSEAPPAASSGGELLDRIKAMRRQSANETGFLVPPIHIKDNLQLKPEEYVFLLKGAEVGRGEVMANHSLAIDPGNAQAGLEGIPTKEPAFGLPAFWVEDSMKDKAKLMGYTVVNPSIVVVTHLTEVVRANSNEILSRQDVQAMLDTLAKTHPKVVEELVPNLLTVGGVQKVLKNLLKERVPIRDILTIVETLADYSPIVKDPDNLTGFVRQALSRTITKQYVGTDGAITCMMLDSGIEETIKNTVQQSQQGSVLALEPSVVEGLLTSLTEGMQAMVGEGHQPILMTSPDIRLFIKGVAERVLPSLIVLSSNEISGNVNIKNYKVVRF